MIYYVCESSRVESFKILDKLGKIHSCAESTGRDSWSTSSFVTISSQKWLCDLSFIGKEERQWNKKAIKQKIRHKTYVGMHGQNNQYLQKVSQYELIPAAGLDYLPEKVPNFLRWISLGWMTTPYIVSQ